MDLNYLLSREQYSLYMAATSLSTSARAAHRAFAHEYGLLLVAAGFPHRSEPAQIGQPTTLSAQSHVVAVNDAGSPKSAPNFVMPPKEGGIFLLARMCLPISRGYLDNARTEGRVAAYGEGADERHCPYLSCDRPMTRHAWLRGFRETQSVSPPQP